MTRAALLALLCSGWLFTTAAAPRAEEASAAPMEQLFAQGETIDLNLTWLGISGGGMRMTIAPAPGDAAHFRMTSIARSSKGFSRILKVRDEMQSLVTRTGFSTVRYAKHLNERGKRKDDVTTVDQARRVATRRRPAKFDESVRVPDPVFDPLSLIYHLRTLPLTPGLTHQFPLVTDGKLYVVQAQVTGRESLDTPLGTFRTIVVEPRMTAGGLFRDENSRLTIWYSDDERRIPVRIRSEVKVGTITATIRGVRAGVDSIEPVVK